MERIKALIDQIHQLKEENAAPSALLLKVQVLYNELLQMQQQSASAGSSKVSVTMPFQFNVSEEIFRSQVAKAPEAGEEKILFELEPGGELYRDEEETQAPAASAPPPSSYSLKKPEHREEPAPVKEQKPQQPARPAQPSFISEAASEAPTLTQHQPAREIHEVIAESKESLNDRLKQDQKEIVHALKGAPIKDLRKAVGINDRFTFVNELFRGDDAMYERSIKTINNFQIFSEAEYWISRELKHKLGWDDSNATVQHFYELVRRRFS